MTRVRQDASRKTTTLNRRRFLYPKEALVPRPERGVGLVLFLWPRSGGSLSSAGFGAPLFFRESPCTGSNELSSSLRSHRSSRWAASAAALGINSVGPVRKRPKETIKRRWPRRCGRKTRTTWRSSWRSIQRRTKSRGSAMQNDWCTAKPGSTWFFFNAAGRDGGSIILKMKQLQTWTPSRKKRPSGALASNEPTISVAPVFFGGNI